MRTALQNHTRRRRIEARTGAAMDGDAFAVGRLDALLDRSPGCPRCYEGPQAAQWRSGYQQGLAEQRARYTFTQD